MLCSSCGNPSDKYERFCRKCGADLNNAALAPARRGFLKESSNESALASTAAKDPDELVGNGLASVFIGDGFFFVGILLSVLESSVSSLLWLLLLIPAFFFFGKGVSDIFHAKQIRRRAKQNELSAAPTTQSSFDLKPASSVTERTTRQLK